MFTTKKSWNVHQPGVFGISPISTGCMVITAICAGSNLHHQLTDSKPSGDFDRQFFLLSIGDHPMFIVEICWNYRHDPINHQADPISSVAVLASGIPRYTQARPGSSHTTGWFQWFNDHVINSWLIPFIPSDKLTVCYWKWPFIVNFPMKNGVFP